MEKLYMMFWIDFSYTYIIVMFIVLQIYICYTTFYTLLSWCSALFFIDRPKFDGRLLNLQFLFL